MSPDYNDPLARLLSAPTLAHMKRQGIPLSKEAEAVAHEDNAEMREFRGEQYLEKVRGKNLPPAY